MATTKDRTWRRHETVVFAKLEKGGALLDTQRNVYYALEGIGPFLWQSIATDQSLDSLCDLVTAAYEVPAHVARADISAWLGKLESTGLIAGSHD